MKKVIAEFLVDDEILIDAYEEMYGIENFHDAFNSELSIMEEYGVECLDWKVIKEEKAE